mgnify:CR=1 FL=1
MGVRFSLFLIISIAGNISEQLPNEIDGWIKEPEIQFYTPENLFDYIDGEAERYLPYEFRLLTVINYKNKGNNDENIEVQIYEMSSTLNAFGIFSAYRDPKKDPFPCGNAGIVGGNQAMFYQAKYFVKLLGNNTSVTSAHLLSIGKKISEILPQEKLEARELKCLDVESKIPNTEKYLAKDVLSQSFFPKGFVVQFKIGERIATAFIVLYEDVGKANKGWDRYIKYLEDLSAEFKLNENNIEVTSPGSEICIATLLKTRIIGIWMPGGDTEKMKPAFSKLVFCLQEN